jgi:shikimate dehydrogenase
MVNKDTHIYCSFSSTPGNNGCIYFNKHFGLYNLNSIYKSFYSDNLKRSIEAVKTLDIKGFALSMPFKVEVLSMIDKLDESAKEIGAVNTVINDKGFLIGYNTDWIGAQKYIEKMEINVLYILGNGGFGKAVQYACKSLNIDYKIITRENWNILFELKNQIIFNATPVDITTNNTLIDGRPFTKAGKAIALIQAMEQFKIYTGIEC